MTLFRFTAEARADLYEIWSYIAADNERAANRVEAESYKACAFIAAGPFAASSGAI